MKRKPRRVMAAAVRMGRLAAVIVVDGRLLAWETSDVAVYDDTRTAATLREWIGCFRPDALVCENPDEPGDKGERSIACLRIIDQVFDDRPERHFMLIRRQTHNNRYEEADALARRYPTIRCELPKQPPCWEKEHPNLAQFEALSLADQFLSKGSTK